MKRAFSYLLGGFLYGLGIGFLVVIAVLMAIFESRGKCGH